jgi:hypothetical protein
MKQIGSHLLITIQFGGFFENSGLKLIISIKFRGVSINIKGFPQNNRITLNNRDPSGVCRRQQALGSAGSFRLRRPADSISHWTPAGANGVRGTEGKGGGARTTDDANVAMAPPPASEKERMAMI